nr:hypothetical protein [Tanacetum cinerariifolium]
QLLLKVSPWKGVVRFAKKGKLAPSLSEDIQCASSDTRPPMLDRVDFASWQQRIRLYYREKDWYNADIRATNILLQGLPKDIYTLINHYTDAKDIWDNVKMLLEWSRTNPRGGGAAGYGGVQNRVGNANPGHIARNCTQPKRPQNSDYYKDKMLLMQAQENRVAFDEEQLLFLTGGQDTAIDEDVDEQPVQNLALNMDNYVKDNAVPVVHSNVSSVPNGAYMMIYNNMYEPHAQSVSKTS